MIVDPSIPQPQPLPAMGVRSSSDIVDHLDRVLKSQPPEVQAAVDHAHSIVGMTPPSQAIADTPESAAAPLPSNPAPDAAPITSSGSGVDSALLGSSPQPIQSSPSMAQPLPSSVSANPHMQNLERMTAEGPGVNKIHNPVLRGLAHVGDAIGSGLFPEFTSFIPGFTAHHNELLGEEENQLGQEQKATKAADESAQSQAATEHEQGLTAGMPSEAVLRNAQADEAAARAENIRNPQKALSPKDKYTPVGDGVWNNDSGDWAKEPTDKKLAEVTEISPEKGKAIGLIANKDGKYLVPNASLAGLLKPAPEKTISPEQQFLDEYKVKHPGSSIADAEKAYKQLVPKEGPDHGASFIDPKTHKLIRVEPGQDVPEGAVTASGLNQQSVAGDKKTQALSDAAKTAQEDYELAQEYAKAPSPTNDFALMMHFIGATKPESIGKLRLNQNEIKLVLGLRSAFQDVEAWGHKFADGQLLPEGQRKNMLDTMKIIADRAQSHAGGGPSAQNHPTVTSQQEFDALPHGAVFIENGKQFKKP